MAARLADGAKTDKSPALVSHFISDGLKVDRVSLLQLSLRELRLITRYRYNIIAIEAFKRSYAQVPAGRIDPDEHRGTAIWTRMIVNFVGREAKERVRRRHMLSFDQSNCKVGSKSVLSDWAPTCRFAAGDQPPLPVSCHKQDASRSHQAVCQARQIWHEGFCREYEIYSRSRESKKPVVTL